VAFNVPPGALGGLYGSGCFHFSNSFSVSLNNICLQQRVRETQPLEANFVYPPFSGIIDVSFCIEQLSNVNCLTSPQIPLHGPVQGKLQGPSVEGAVKDGQQSTASGRMEEQYRTALT